MPEDVDSFGDLWNWLHGREVSPVAHAIIAAAGFALVLHLTGGPSAMVPAPVAAFLAAVGAYVFDTLSDLLAALVAFITGNSDRITDRGWWTGEMLDWLLPFLVCFLLMGVALAVA